MERYLGVKEIKAKPMTLQEYNDYRGWDIPQEEDPAKAGYLVEYLDGGESNHPDHKGYISWSPADVFDRAYRPVSGMTFGLAIEAMKRGHKVCRKGWNGKAIYIFIVDSAVGLKRVGFDGEMCDVSMQQHIAIDTTMLQTDNLDAPKSVVPWLASQTDMLAEDWMIVD
jgi:hypothetical protein